MFGSNLLFATLFPMFSRRVAMPQIFIHQLLCCWTVTGQTLEQACGPREERRIVQQLLRTHDALTVESAFTRGKQFNKCLKYKSSTLEIIFSHWNWNTYYMTITSWQQKTPKQCVLQSKEVIKTPQSCNFRPFPNKHLPPPRQATAPRNEWTVDFLRHPGVASHSH